MVLVAQAPAGAHRLEACATDCVAEQDAAPILFHSSNPAFVKEAGFFFAKKIK